MTTVVAIVDGKRLEVGRYADAATAELVATSWAKWSGCKGVVILSPTLPPLVLIHPPAAAPLPR